MSKSVFDGNPNSKYDAGLIVKEVHDFYGQSIRTTDANSVVKNFFTHFRAIYDVDNKPTEITYYRGMTAHKTSFDVIASPLLATGYFELHSAPDNQLWVVWFNVDGASTQPSVPGAKYIEVAIDSGDTAAVISTAIALTINALYKDVFVVTRNGTNVEIRTYGLGEVSPSDEAMTPFTFAQVPGTQAVVQKIVLTYSGTDPIYEGQILKGYTYDIYSGKFVQKVSINVDNIDVNLDSSTDSVSIGDEDGDKLQINPDGSVNVNVVQTAQVLKSYFFEVSNVVTGITETLCTYTALAPVYLQKIEFSGTNIAAYELDIDGVITDKKLTFFNGNLENKFDFNQGLNIELGQVITVKVYHNRPDPGTFNARMQILESGA
jgi:hypothetical protein